MCLWIRIPDQEMICGYQFFRISFYQEQNDPPICRAWGNGWERGKSCRGWGEGTGVRSDIWSPLFHLWVQLCVASRALSSSRFCFRLFFFTSTESWHVEPLMWVAGSSHCFPDPQFSTKFMHLAPWPGLPVLLLLHYHSGLAFSLGDDQIMKSCSLCLHCDPQPSRCESPTWYHPQYLPRDESLNPEPVIGGKIHTKSMLAPLVSLPP